MNAPTPPDQAAQELRKKIASTWLTREDDLRFKVELPPDQVDALLALMYQETLAIVGSNETTIIDDKNLGPDWLQEERNKVRDQLRRAGAKRYGQIRGEG